MEYPETCPNFKPATREVIEQANLSLSRIDEAKKKGEASLKGVLLAASLYALTHMEKDVTLQ